MKKNIFVLALDDFTNALFGTIRQADSYRYHSLLPPRKIIAAANYSMPELLATASRQLERFEGRVDAIVSYWDFPTTLMLPTLRRAAGLPTTSLESILRCEHKLWSRAIQREVVPEMIPRVSAFDPFAADPLSRIDLDFPFWIKPVKAHSSILGFRIECPADFHAATPLIRQRIGRFSDPFNYLFQRAEVPGEIAAVDGNHCLAEEIITAQHQCTLEGYVFHGEPRVFGVIDSLRETNRSSFSRYHYPSRLPQEVQQRMIEVTLQVMRRTGLNNEPFNIEFFHDPQTGRISLLEINPRISKSHCPLFHLVEGASQQEVMLEVALGIQPNYPRGAGAYPMATKFMVRRYAGDAWVRRVPRAVEIAAMQQEIDGVLVMVWVKEGDRLSEFTDSDSYSFEYANIFIGGKSEEELLSKQQRCLEMLPFEFEPLTAQAI
ncbi:ATP-grasp domain-containing protein [Geopsychrobacter electrodiphilus]|uniref:ATP-grasp domain-containing protein n=1 Tax=Geopsychrobacter electrodiphilus TaxID=225196 RepID=UPI0003796F4B|nr:ATP-grasp domain-containing protein [Geopsychrobacter electrodiphilus]